MTAGLLLPRLTEADPDVVAEGSIDPLGLGGIADALVELIAPGVTARMTRPRLVTAMAVSSVVAAEFPDRVAADRVTPPWLVVEWHLVEALVGAKGLPPRALRGVGGSAKTRAALQRGAHLDARSYLMTPKVFGFHGVFKRLALDLQVLDDALALTERGYELVRAWEHEQELDGFVDDRPGSPGASIRRALRRAVDQALMTATAQPLGGVGGTLAAALRPDGAGRRERDLLWQWLTDPVEPLRRELLLALAAEETPPAREEASLRALASDASHELRLRLDAIEAYEALSCTLTRAFDALRVMSRQMGLVTIDVSTAATLPEVEDGARTVPALHTRTTAAIGPVDPGGLMTRIEIDFGRFSHPMAPRDLVVGLLDHHDEVQARKLPGGKRPWFERVPTGFTVRPLYGLDQQVVEPGSYVHPTRVPALLTFCEDLR